MDPKTLFATLAEIDQELRSLNGLYAGECPAPDTFKVVLGNPLEKLEAVRAALADAHQEHCEDVRDMIAIQVFPAVVRGWSRGINDSDFVFAAGCARRTMILADALLKELKNG